MDETELNVEPNKDSNQVNSANSKGPEYRQWPSERIVHGGLFHTPKVEYSKETADLIKLLMEESKMSMMMRKQVNDCLRNGEPLSVPESRRVISFANPDSEALEILKRARNAKRKSLDKILASGAYEMPRYRPKPTDRIPSEKAKIALQEAMSGMRLAESNLKAKRRQKPKEEQHATTTDIINELLDQITERADWLAEMEELGEGKKYRDEIREQIAQRLRQIKGLENKLALEKNGIRYVD